MLENLALVIEWLTTRIYYCISASRVNSGTINTFKKRVSVELEPETVN